MKRKLEIFHQAITFGMMLCGIAQLALSFKTKGDAFVLQASYGLLLIIAARQK